MVLNRGEERKWYVKEMFNSIAHRYDLLNHLLSLGLDIYWRKKAISKLNRNQTYQHVLDLACGTGDFAQETARRKNTRVISADIALRMLKYGKKKARLKSVSMLNADAEQLPVKDARFEAVTIAFGMRNMGDVDAALKEMYRILRKEGQCIILEFSLPKTRLLRYIYSLYFDHILPLLGRLISGHPEAYTYLPVSVDAFPRITHFIKQMESAGFRNIQTWPLLFGVAVIYKGIRENSA